MSTKNIDEHQGVDYVKMNYSSTKIISNSQKENINTLIKINKMK